MPFNYKEYEAQCSRMSKVQLRKEIERHNDVVASAGAGTGLALLAVPLTMGLSAVAIGGTAPAIINARKKRTIAKKYLELPGPEVGPNFSTQTPALRPMNRGASSSKPRAADDELPAYTPGDIVPQEREKQTYVPVEELEMDLPPSYDELNIKRRTMMGLPPLHSTEEQQTSNTEEQWSVPGASNHDQESTTAETKLAETSAYEQNPLQLSRSASLDTPDSLLGPRTPSPTQHEPPMDLLGEGDEQTAKGKGKSVWNRWSKRGKGVAV